MLTQEQIDSFYANGFLVMRGVVKGEELRLLSDAVDEVIRQGVELQGQPGHDHLYLPGARGNKVYWRSEKMWTRGDIFLAATAHPEILENIGQLVGDSFVPFNDSLVVKVPHEGAAVTWHQDPPYGDPKRLDSLPGPNFTTDIYLDHSGTDNGCVYAIPGHHLVGHVDYKSKSEEELFEKYGAVPVLMEPGDVLFHCVSTPHGSRANLSALKRRIFYIHYMTEAVCRQSYPNWTSRFAADGGLDLELYASMLEARKRLGFAGIEETGTVAFDRCGFRFTSSPSAAVHDWAARFAAISAAEKERLKRLLPV
ncbi:MAG: phytanoyl-CoA dioxygenase family protein [Paenibacillaceae bacterium]|nr:phytanoyl-CoA dioxygenase family protein [Paenibacillaceae bacterium]